MQSRFLPCALLLLLLMMAGCGGGGSAGPPAPEAEGPGATHEAGAQESADREAPAPAELPPELTVTYERGAAWVESLPEEERADQIRDWTVVGLAAALDLDVRAARDFFYDRAPVRDPILRDLATTRVGSGRYLPDSAGVLHVLAPMDDPHLDRTVGVALDDYRTDAGADLPRTRVHRYRIDPASHTVTVATGPPDTTTRVRRRHGYRSRDVGELAALRAFLRETDHLSRLEVRDGGVWASGWAWPGVPTSGLTVEDVTVLQHAYREAAAGRGPDPGFSLDPGPPSPSDDDLLAMYRGEDRREMEEILDRVNQVVRDLRERAEAAGEPGVSPFRVMEVAADAFERDIDLAAVALNTWTEDPVYQFARYDGPLQGTEVGMTYFYTDLVAKAWPLEKGVGSPAGQVPGFVSNVEARTPWSQCRDELEESGRLWFGLREEGVAPSPRKIDLAGLTTRLFSLVEDPASDAGREVEPSYGFGRIIDWWDDHYVALADYEPQYHRLDQLMRWGAALAWLVNQDGPALPQVPMASVRRDHVLPEWMAAHGDLRWRYDGPWVHPRGVDTEALPTLRSRDYESCGSVGYWSGGISAPQRSRLDRLAQTPDLPRGVSRPGIQRGGTALAADGTGTLARERVTHRLGSIRGRAASVQAEATGRKVWSLGRLRAWVSESAVRRAALDLQAGGRRLLQRLSIQGTELGTVAATARGTRVTVEWRPGLLDRARTAFHHLQEHLPSRGLEEAARRAEGSSMVYVDQASGRVHLRLDGGAESRWAVVESGLPQPGETLQFRLGAPGPDGLRWYHARLSEQPALRNSRDGWFGIELPAGGGPGSIGGSGPPGPGARRFAVLGPDGEPRGSFWLDGRRVHAKTDDPLFGLSGAPDGPPLLRRDVLERIEEAARRGRAAADGDPRLIALDRWRAALVDARDPARTELIPVDEGHAWHGRVQEILAATDGGVSPRVRPGDTGLERVAELRLAGAGKPGDAVILESALRRAAGRGSVADPRGPPLYVSKSARLVLAEPDLPFEVLGTRLRVRVVEAAGSARTTPMTPGIGLWDGTEWTLARRPGGGDGGTASAGGVPGAGAAGAGDGAGTPVPPWLLLYAADDCDSDETRTLQRCS